MLNSIIKTKTDKIKSLHSIESSTNIQKHGFLKLNVEEGKFCKLETRHTAYSYSTERFVVPNDDDDDVEASAMGFT